MANTQISSLDKRFGYTAAGSNLRTEIMAGITTFFAMVYILMVNANMFTAAGVSYGAIYIATAISAVVGTVCIGLLANLPLAQASGMGLNAFFVFTCVLGFGMSYANALVLVLFDGILFIVLTVTGLRKMIFQAIPQAVRIAIPAGIGLFIAFLGLQNADIVIPDSSTGVTLASFNLLTNSWGAIMPMLVTILALLAIAVMAHKNVKGAVLLGIVGGAVLYYVLGFLTVSGFSAGITMSSPFAAFGEFFNEAFLTVFTKGFNFSAYIAAHGGANTVLVIVTTALAFCMVDMFDTMGTLYGACARGNMLTKDGEVPNMDKAMMADAIATTVGAVCGTSTVTTFVESSAGVAEGGRTGMAAMVTAVLFFIAMFLSPIAQLIPGCATAAALVYVGVLMMACVKNIDWTDIEVAVPAFLTAALMPFTYNISYGIAFGLISYVIIKVCTGKVKDVSVPTWVITALFLLMLFLTH
ncbi:MAG: NCS2 family permease [Christensenellaceae bacterium]|nr:NCS2 family permease [Christensenellaceae bacterium]